MPKVHILILVFGVLSVGILTEIVLRCINPVRLWRDAFDEAYPMESHDVRGWTSKKNFSFDFHHRYLRKRVKINLNSIGAHDRSPPEIVKTKEALRVAFLGGTTAAGWELERNQTVGAMLRENLSRKYSDRKVELIDASTRLYSTRQLYHHYCEEVRKYRPDIVIYYFNLNHPRRVITGHESGKSINLSQPIFAIGPDGQLVLRKTDPPTNKNDLIYLDETGEICRIPGTTTRTLWGAATEWSHLATLIDDLIQGPVRLRKFQDRREIKDIELWKDLPERVTHLGQLPFQWRVIEKVLGLWAKTVSEHSGKFFVASTLAYYCTREGGLFSFEPKHPWGFSFDKIPERKYLEFIAGMHEFSYLDTYSEARNRGFPGDGFYVHPRYCYFNQKGADFAAAGIANLLPTIDQLKT